MIRYTDFRLDASTLRDYPDGSIRVSGQLTHPGTFTYRNPDGTPRREYRPAEEVFRKGALDTFAGAPITVSHPKQANGQRVVTAQSWKKDAIGHLGDNVRQDGEHMVADLYVKDAGAVARVRSGDLRHISCGYEVDYDATPGTAPDGSRYDGVQRNIRANHVALLPTGEAPRGGSECVLRLDSEGDEVIALKCDVTPEQIAALEAQMVALKSELASARTDAAEVATLRKALTDTTAALAAANALLAPERLDSLVDARAAVVATAKAAGIVTEKVATLTLKRAIVAKRTPALAERCDSLSAETLDAVLATYAAEPHASLAAVAAAAAAVDATKTGGARTDAVDPNKLPSISDLYAKSVAASKAAWLNTGDVAVRN